MSLLKRRKYDRNHIIIGRVHSRSGAVKERLADDVHTEQFFHEMRKLMWQLRPWWKQCFSLKSTRAFGLYECFPNHAYHVPIKLDVQTQATLAEFYHDFNHGREETQRRWLPWIQEHFNAGDHSQQPHEARYGLQIIQRWSATKLAVFGSVPILLSFAVGFWFQFSVEGELTAVTQTAWTISGFVIGAAGVGIAILAAVSQYGDD
ncbi:hypothetical protein EJ04DRAFT_489580 [Polyplosphaeria fusca]|uniref:Uncharacterized protein n=1 Tax=Polyplosphaeria fusca TaxID=682080 RepID=A0A9P4V5R3_9PLEO|nr:hypothetical protein EJ04DRAFT_489580 [Polyplosphaeria fusca]